MPETEHKIHMVCRFCGSADVTKDANAAWDYQHQCWTLAGTFDKPDFCEDCVGETRIVEVTDAQLRQMNTGKTANSYQQTPR